MNFWQWLERLLETKDDCLPKEKADVVVAVGIDVSLDGLKVSPQSEGVARKAAELFLNGRAANILLVGGYPPGRVTEAELMANVVIDQALAARASLETLIFLETASFRTFMNADRALPILKRHGWRSAIIVAQQWHARRVRATFRRRWAGSGIEFSVIKARSDYGGGSRKRLNHFWTFVLWDSLAFIVSKIKGYC